MNIYSYHVMSIELVKLHCISKSINISLRMIRFTGHICSSQTNNIFFYLAYPRPDVPSSTVEIEEGQSEDIVCSIPHQKTDSLHWFKVCIIIFIDRI